MADTYEVTDVTETRVLKVGGGVADVVRVTFATKPSGATGTVDVPKEAFTVDAVDAAVRPYAAQLEHARAL